MRKFGITMIAVLLMQGPKGAPDYKSALSKSILFFEGERSGPLPPNQRLTWRRDSALRDGSDQNIDLVGGYYGGGDNVKFGFPIDFTMTMLAWSVVEFGDCMGNELENAKAAIRWTTDYFFKATSTLPQKMFGSGNPYGDHNCWERPEDMDTPRTVYSVDTEHPGSEVAGETAAAKAAASIVFKTLDPTYSQNLLQAATQIFDFADKYRGAYSDSLDSSVRPFCCDFRGYQDKLLRGASWLHKASGNDYYLDYIHTNEKILGADKTINEFGWDNKHARLNFLVVKEYLIGNVVFLQLYKSHVNSFTCSLLPETSSTHVDYTLGFFNYTL